ncbi:hypothetical protein ES705_14583 [subsurface metagenome]
MNTKNEDKKPEAETADQPTLEQILAELPVEDKYKKLLVAYITGVNQSLLALSNELADLKQRPAAALPQDSAIFEGLDADQKYNVLMAQASAPAAAAQQGLLTAMLGRVGGGGNSGGLDGVLANANTLNALRQALAPPPSALESAMQKAQISQVVAQTRLMNKVTGKATDQYLDSILEELKESGSET